MEKLRDLIDGALTEYQSGELKYFRFVPIETIVCPHGIALANYSTDKEAKNHLVEYLYQSIKYFIELEKNGELKI